MYFFSANNPLPSDAIHWFFDQATCSIELYILHALSPARSTRENVKWRDDVVSFLELCCPIYLTNLSETRHSPAPRRQRAAACPHGKDTEFFDLFFWDKQPNSHLLSALHCADDIAQEFGQIFSTRAE